MTLDLNWILECAACDAAQQAESGDDSGLRWRKEVIYADTFRKYDQESGEVLQEFKVTESDLSHWEKTANAMLSAGVGIPMPAGHTSESDKKKATTVRFERDTDSKGRKGLFVVYDFKSSKAKEEHLASDVSIYVEPAYFHDKGTWHRPITHVAFTDYPVVGDLDPATIACSNEPPKGSTMTAKELAAAFNIQIPENLAGNEDAAMKYVKGRLQVKASNDPPPKPVPPVPPTPKPPESPESDAIKQLTLSNRSMRIDALVASKQLLPAEAKELKSTWADKETLSLSNEASSAFESVLASFSAREPLAVLSTESTGGQVVSPEKSVLVQGAEKIAAATKTESGITGNSAFV